MEQRPAAWMASPHADDCWLTRCHVHQLIYTEFVDLSANEVTHPRTRHPETCRSLHLSDVLALYVIGKSDHEPGTNLQVGSLRGALRNCIPDIRIRLHVYFQLMSPTSHTYDTRVQLARRSPHSAPLFRKRERARQRLSATIRRPALQPQLDTAVSRPDGNGPVRSFSAAFSRPPS